MDKKDTLLSIIEKVLLWAVALLSLFLTYYGLAVPESQRNVIMSQVYSYIPIWVWIAIFVFGVIILIWREILSRQKNIDNMPAENLLTSSFTVGTLNATNDSPSNFKQESRDGVNIVHNDAPIYINSKTREDEVNNNDAADSRLLFAIDYDYPDYKQVTLMIDNQGNNWDVNGLQVKLLLITQANKGQNPSPIQVLPSNRLFNQITGLSRDGTLRGGQEAAVVIAKIKQGEVWVQLENEKQLFIKEAAVNIDAMVYGKIGIRRIEPKQITIPFYFRTWEPRFYAIVDGEIIK